MRPETAYNLVTKTIEQYLYKSKPFPKITQKAVDKLLEKALIEEARIADEWGHELEQHKFENYHTEYDVDCGCYWNMMYISDRFNCVHRLVWLQYGLINGLFNPSKISK